MTKIIPGFDAVALQHEGAQRIYEETKDMTLEQELAYWRTHADALLEEQRALREAARPAKQGEELVEQAP
jgi:hypothetical protein